MARPELSDNDIQSYATADSFERGRQYFERRAVYVLTQRGNRVEARVIGSQPTPYQVWVSFNESGPSDADCTCPYDWGGWCKHIVATLLTCRERPEAIDERPSLADLLADLDRDQLQALLLQLAELVPNLTDQAEIIVHGIKQHPTRSPVLDPDLARHQVRTLQQNTGYRPRSGYDFSEGTSLAGFRDLVRRVLEPLESGNAEVARQALRTLEAMTEEYLDNWDPYVESYDDDFPLLGDAWAEVILSADLSLDEREALADRLTGWQDQLLEVGYDDAFDTALQAAVVGWDDPRLRYVLTGDDAGPAEAAEPDSGLSWWADLVPLRLKILERQQLFDAYLRLARAEKRIGPYLTMLIRLGQVDQACREAETLLTSTGQARAMAQTLWDHGETDRALQLAEGALQLSDEQRVWSDGIGSLSLPGGRLELANWLRDRAAAKNRPRLAFRVGRLAFDQERNLAQYIRLRQLARDEWPSLRADLLDELRRLDSNDSGVIDIFLEEGLVDDAVRAATSWTYAPQLRRVVEGAVESHPDWVVRTCRQQAEPVMDGGKSQYYADAAAWLEKARDAYLLADRENEWRAYLNDLLERHRRKHSLVPLLEQLA